jgi:hypothetical protein
MPGAANQKSSLSRPSLWFSIPPLIMIATAMLAIAGLGAIGGGDALEALSLTRSRLGALVPAVVYMFTAIGLGRLLGSVLRLPEVAKPLESVLGLALLLSLSHVLGQLGLLHGKVGFYITVAISAASMLALAICTLRERGLAPRSTAPSPSSTNNEVPTVKDWLTGLPFLLMYSAAIGVALFAIANPPGSLWASEFGGYDALSYHLQLPQEWLARGRLESLDHNVYSFLPSYVEAAYLHIAALTSAPLAPEFPGGPIGLLAADGWRANACQALHAVFMFHAIAMVVTLATRVAATGVSNRGKVHVAPVLLILLLTPWLIVVGTLAYNEMPMLALFAGALLAASDRTLSATKRGLISGALVAVACGVKPTALLFVGLPTGIILLGTMPMRESWKAVVPGVLVALALLSPWMIRNAIACGNPLFPFALTKQLGTAHWDADQVQRFLGHHISHEPWWDRVKLLVLPDPNDPAARPGSPVYRGVTHPQWGVFFALVALAIGHALFWLRGQAGRLAILLTLIIIVQIVLWLVTTHVQSRFLLPLVVPSAAILALASRTPAVGDEDSTDTRLALTPKLRSGSRLAFTIACWAGVVAQGGFLIATITSQLGGTPASRLPWDPADFTAAAWHREKDATRRESLAANSAAIGLASLVPPGEMVTLLGEAAVFCYPPNIRYNTVWDRWPIRDGVLSDPSIRFVLVDFASIDRYERSGYLSPGVGVKSVQEWMVSSTRLIREWPGEGKILVEVRK